MDIRAKQLQRQKKWRDSNKDRIKEYMDEWRSSNKERLRIYNNEFRAKSESYREWKRQYDKKYYEQVVKNSPSQLALRVAVEKAWRLANPDKRRESAARYRERNPEKVLAAAKAAYWATPEEERKALRLARTDYMRQWRDAHKDQREEYFQNYWAANKSELQIKAQEYYEQNRVAFIQRANKRRVLLTGTYTGEDIDAMYEAQAGICLGCLRLLNGKYEIDHVMPLALDPTGDHLENLQLLCRPCNRRKSDKHPDVWRAGLTKVRHAA